MEINKNNLPENVKILDNGQMEVTITYDVTKHGHAFGKPRNYNVNDIRLMIEDSDTQEEINNGYAKGYYGHSKRDVNSGYLPSEKDTDGNEVEPVSVTKSLSIDGNNITHTQRIFNTDEGIRLQKLILNGGVGFSNVWNIKKKKFFGFDAVVSQNFAGNRVIVDSICAGVCEIDNAIEKAVLDNVGANADTEVKDIAKELLMKDEAVLDMLTIRDTIRGLKNDLQEEQEKNKTLLDELQVEKDKNNTFVINLDTANRNLSEVTENYQNFISSKYEPLITQLDGLGIESNDGNLTMKNDGMKNLFKPKSFEDASKLNFDAISMLNKKDLNIEDRPSFEF